MRRQRALAQGHARFLADHLLDDVVERTGLHARRFERGLLIGCPDFTWRERIGALVGELDVRDPLDGMVEDEWQAKGSEYDVVFAAGTLDTVNDLPTALRTIRATLAPGGLLLGFVPGGHTMPRLRSAMRAADEASGRGAQPHVHPRIEAASLAPLIAAAGFTEPVVDVERIRLRYAGMMDLVRDLRTMAATNVLVQRPRMAIARTALAAAEHDFKQSSSNGKTTETAEILHFSGWS